MPWWSPQTAENVILEIQNTSLRATARGKPVVPARFERARRGRASGRGRDAPQAAAVGRGEGVVLSGWHDDVVGRRVREAGADSAPCPRCGGTGREHADVGAH